MPFPHHDRYWTQTADFIQQHAPVDAPILAPDEFVERFANVFSYSAPAIDRRLSFPWVAIHKGMCEQIDRAFLNDRLQGMPVVFANEVFVVFSDDNRLAPLPEDLAHIAAFRQCLAKLAPSASPPPAANAILRPCNFAALDVDGVRAEMNRRYSQTAHDDHGGYEHPHLWDQARYREVNRLFQKLLGSVSGLDVLEIGCGIGRSAQFFREARGYLGVDLSDVAIDKARRIEGESSTHRFAVMDAMDLRLDNEEFDLVLGMEIIEHLQDADKMLLEVHRVLKPKGRFLFNSANRDSLHLRIVRKLGFPEFRSTREHFREFGFDEMREIVEKIGFDIDSAEGVFLHPFLNVPGVDARIKSLALDDAEIVEALRELGERAGPRFGFEFLIAARKR